MSEPVNATPAQTEAIQKAYSLLGEHFEHVLIVCHWETDVSPAANATEVWYKGGALTALGMAHYASEKLLYNKIPEPSDD
jgi:hypothetical protein